MQLRCNIIQLRCNVDATQMQFKCNSDVIQMHSMCNLHQIEMQSILVLNLDPHIKSNLTFSVEWIGGWLVGDQESKPISDSNYVKVEVEAELGKSFKYIVSFFSIKQLQQRKLRALKVFPEIFLQEELSYIQRRKLTSMLRLYSIQYIVDRFQM